MWAGLSPVPVQMWAGGEPSPGADVDGAEGKKKPRLRASERTKYSALLAEIESVKVRRVYQAVPSRAGHSHSRRLPFAVCRCRVLDCVCALCRVTLRRPSAAALPDRPTPTQQCGLERWGACCMYARSCTRLAACCVSSPGCSTPFHPTPPHPPSHSAEVRVVTRAHAVRPKARGRPVGAHGSKSAKALRRKAARWRWR